VTVVHTQWYGSDAIELTFKTDAGKIADEVLAHLVGLVGADVTVTLEIQATIPSGVPPDVVRVVLANGTELHFGSAAFEQE
jgi:hypothetical protein